MQIPILSGIYTDTTPDFRVSYPVNMVPVPLDNGISAGYLRPAEGAVKLGDGIGTPRGMAEWDDILYSVMGSRFVRINIDNTITDIGDVGDNGKHVTFTYDFDRLAICSNGDLFYWDGTTLTQVTDADLGTALSVTWADGYFMTTDGEYLVVTDLGDPMSINPLKYGSSEIDPDPVVAVTKLRNEIHAVNRYTIEVFENIGGSGFPFQRIAGAQIQKGAIGASAVCVVEDSLAFVGGGKNEPPGVFLAANAQAAKISTPDIDKILASKDKNKLENIVISFRRHNSSSAIWVALDDRTLVYDLVATATMGVPVWYQLVSSTFDFERYRIVDPVYCYDKWMVQDYETGDFGYLSDSTSRQFGEVARWEFGTSILYNEGKGAIVSSLELVCLTGRAESGDTPYVSTSYSIDGLNWSQDRIIASGVIGDRLRRLVWLQQGKMRHWRVQRFRGDGKAMISTARLEATIEALSV